MNTAAAHYPPKEIKRPTGLKEVEICTRSGMLATDRCYDSVRSTTGDAVQKRTTYAEIATQTQMPTEPCNIHGAPRVQTVAEAAPPEAPRAELATDVSDVRPVVLKAPTLLSESDPYNSVKAIARAEPKPDEKIIEQPATEKIDNAQKTETRDETQTRGREAGRTEVRAIEKPKSVDEQKPVLRAIPVQPQPAETPVEIRRAVPVGPMDEVEQGALLKAATASPSEEDD